MNENRTLLWVVALLFGCLIGGHAGSIHAAGLGRLFTTPKERALLQRARIPKPHAVKKEPQPHAPVPELEEPKPVIPPITVNGYVQRSDGSNTVWVNGTNSFNGDLESQYIKVNPHRIRGSTVSIKIDDDAIGTLDMRVGQSFDPEAKTLIDGYQTPP